MIAHGARHHRDRDDRDRNGALRHEPDRQRCVSERQPGRAASIRRALREPPAVESRHHGCHQHAIGAQRARLEHEAEHRREERARDQPGDVVEESGTQAAGEEHRRHAPRARSRLAPTRREHRARRRLPRASTSAAACSGTASDSSPASRDRGARASRAPPRHSVLRCRRTRADRGGSTPTTPNASASRRARPPIASDPARQPAHPRPLPMGSQKSTRGLARPRGAR